MNKQKSLKQEIIKAFIIMLLSFPTAIATGLTISWLDTGNKPWILTKIKP